MNWNETLLKIEKILNNAKFVVLATANKEGIVSASQMCVINDGLKVYFQTDSKFEKVKNISENPHVAINFGSTYFKGKASLIGHPTKNIDYVEKLKVKYPWTYKNYTNLPSEMLIEVELTECRIWGIDNSKNVHQEETIQVIDLINKTDKIINCDKM